ncbi:hypothetical protein BZZ01_15100 [Nostocales cyanobacterium HT-58-2]|nr:hypothetical protein BZZ01_15100 [Nostocales cyanobacterium HT-58-2]
MSANQVPLEQQCIAFSNFGLETDVLLNRKRDRFVKTIDSQQSISLPINFKLTKHALQQSLKSK